MTDIHFICLTVFICCLLATVGWLALIALLWRIMNVVKPAVNQFKLKKVDITGRKVLIEGEDV